MSSRVGFALAVVFLLLGAGLRMWELSTLPAGLSDDEITDVRIAETVRQGTIEVFYNLGGEGREGLYHMALTAFTSVVGNGTLGFRLLSVWAGLATLALVYALASRLFGTLAGVAALALLTVNFADILLSRHVGREALLPLLVVAVLLTMARALAVYKEVHPRLPVNTAFGLLGLLLGLGFYVHPAHFMIVLFSMVFIASRLLARSRPPRQTIPYLLFSMLVLMIVAMPYLISTIRLPELAGAGRVFGSSIDEAKPPLQAIFDGIAGILFLGDADPIRNLPGRPLIDLFSGVVVLIGVLMAARHWRQARYSLLLVATVVLIPVCFLAGDSPNFAAYAPLLPLLALFFGLGIHTLYQSTVPSTRRIAAFGLAALLVFNLVWMGRDLFVNWPVRDDVQTAYNSRIGSLAHYLDQTAGSIPTVICDSSLGRISNQLSNTDLLLIMMNRKAAHLRYADCGTGMIFVNGGVRQQVVMPDADTLAMMQTYLRDWVMRGEVVNQPNVPSDSVVIMDVAGVLADTVGRFTTTAPAGYAPEAGAGLAVPPVRFGGNIAFLGYEPWDGTPYPPGGILTTVTYWRVDGVVPPDLRFFTHVLADPAACCTAQNDTISVDVRQLNSRDVFVQITFVPLPFSAPAGEYDVSVGAYLGFSRTRMGVLEGDQQRGTRLFLGQIQIERPA